MVPDHALEVRIPLSLGPRRGPCIRRRARIAGQSMSVHQLKEPLDDDQRVAQPLPDLERRLRMRDRLRVITGHLMEAA
jgi:hypothetical protein